MTVIDISKTVVSECLPQRSPFLFIDFVEAYKPFELLVARRKLEKSEFYFAGHFVNRPVFPGVLMIETMAQAGSLMAYLSLQATYKDHLYVLTKVDQAKFKTLALPGDELRVEVKTDWQRGVFWQVTGQISVDEKEICSAVLTSARVPLS